MNSLGQTACATKNNCNKNTAYVTEHNIGKTTYFVNSLSSEQAADTLHAKIEKLILRDMKMDETG